MIEPTIFVGPPGTGKTTTLLDTVDHEMANGVPPDRIGFMTFTKRGVEEAVTRASDRFNLSRHEFRFFNTLHAAAFRHLGLSSSQVFTGKRIYEFGQAHGLELHAGLSNDDGTYSSFYGDDIVLFLENLARITRRPLEAVLADHEYELTTMMVYDPIRVRNVIRDFRQYKKDNYLFDFTDMLETFVAQNNPPHLEVLMVDEAQDLSELQWEMVFQLAQHVKRWYVAGDDDQTIFTWAGASERFITLPGKVHVLNQSFRVPHHVHQLANRMINKISNRRKKLWLPRDAQGSNNILTGITALDPSDIDSGKSVMLLGRTSKMLRRDFIPFCQYHGILYQHFDAYSIRPSYAKAITAWNDLQAGKTIPAALALSIYNLLKSERKGISNPGVKRNFKTRIGQLADQKETIYLSMQDLQKDYGLLATGDWDEALTEIDVKEVDYIKKVLKNGCNITDKPRVHISTIHRVKGGQADTVVLLSDTAKAGDQVTTASLDQETRVFYTGVTRTFQDLYIVQPRTTHTFLGLFE